MRKSLVRTLLAASILVGLMTASAMSADGTDPVGGGQTKMEKSGVVKWLEARHLGPKAVVVVVAMLPIFELRGSIPVAILYYKMPLWEAYLLSIIGNMIPIIPIILLIGPVSDFLMKRSKLWHRFFTWVFERSRRRGADLVEKYEALGLCIFVAIPLPVTGAWTGAMLAFLMRVHARRAFPAILAGVLTAGIVVTAVTKFGQGTFHFFLNM